MCQDPVKYLPSAQSQFPTSVSRREWHQELLQPYCLLHLPAEWAACGCACSCSSVRATATNFKLVVFKSSLGERELLVGFFRYLEHIEIIEGLKDRHLRRNLIIISELPVSDTILREWATRNLIVKLVVAHGYILLRNINSTIME